jgi:hypothetical protein
MAHIVVEYIVVEHNIDHYYDPDKNSFIYIPIMNVKNRYINVTV